MRLATYVHRYVLGQPATGADWTLHDILRWFVRQGHEATVVVNRLKKPAEVDGVSVVGGRPDEHFKAADVCLSQLELTRHVASVARTYKKPVVHLAHKDTPLQRYGVETRNTDLVVFNSEWVADSTPWNGNKIVVHPPVFVEDYQTSPGEYITLINCNYSKGAEIFWKLVRAEPERKFLAVRGAYGHQVIYGNYKNVKVVDYAPRVTEIYSQTRVLLMPSQHESWGRCAVEAACSGIPTLASQAKGLREALDTAGVYLRTDSVEPWREALASLDDPLEYSRRSAVALARAKALDPVPGLQELEQTLEALVARRALNPNTGVANWIGLGAPR